MDLPESITAGGVTSTYRYDNAGQRISKKVGSGNVEYTIRDGATTLGAFTLNGSGTPTSWHFNILAGGAAIGRHTNAGARFYYHTDMLGSTRAVVNASGTVTEAYNYYAFGLLNEGLSYAPGRDQGAVHRQGRDAETHMSFGARYYWCAPIGRTPARLRNRGCRRGRRRAPYPPEFRARLVELPRGRSPEELHRS